MRRLILAGTIIVTGCVASQPRSAGDSPSPGDFVVQHQIGTLTAGSVDQSADDSNVLSSSMQYFMDPAAYGRIVGAPPAEVWPLLLRAYEGVAIHPDFVDSLNLTVADSRLEFTRWLGGLRANPFITCGTSATGLDLADRSQWHSTSIASRLLLLGEDSTAIVTRFEAIALPSRASLGKAPDCRSTGQLEELILGRISADLEEEATPSAGHEAPSSSLSILLHQDVRVTVHSSRHVTGTLASVRSNMLVIRTPVLTSVPLGSVTRLEVRRSRSSRGKVGALLGVAAGTLTGWAAVEGAEGHWGSQGRMLGPGLGAIAGGLLGAFIGSLFGGDFWEEVSLDAVGSGGLAPESRVEFRLPVPWPGPH